MSRLECWAAVRNFSKELVWMSVVALLLVSCGAAPELGSPGAPSTAVSVPTTAPAQITDAVPAAAADGQTVSVAVVDGAGEEPTGNTVSARMLVSGGRTITLAAQPFDGLGGSLLPWVIADASGSRVYYTTWEDRRDLDDADIRPGDVAGVPVIRKVELVEGQDEVFRRGAYAPAVAGDGRVAYVEDIDGVYRFSVDNPNRVIVVSPRGDEVWSTDNVSKYITMGWAGDVLIVYQTNEGGYLRILAFDGPGRSRILSEGGDVGAISPDGSELLIVEPNAAGSRFFVVNAADGLRQATLDAESAPELQSILAFHGGDWTGDRIVVPTGSGFVALVRGSESLTLEHVVDMQLEGFSTVRPHLDQTADGSTWMLVATVNGGTHSYTEVVCDLELTHCHTASEPMDPQTTATVGNPSKGLEYDLH